VHVEQEAEWAPGPDWKVSQKGKKKIPGTGLKPGATEHAASRYTNYATPFISATTNFTAVMPWEGSR
jgi:hypothetical protein